MLALGEQRVRLYECMFELEGVITWRRMMHYDTNAIAHWCAVQIHYNVWRQHTVPGFSWDGIVLALDEQKPVRYIAMIGVYLN